jgi:hypothetical protein
MEESSGTALRQKKTDMRQLSAGCKAQIIKKTLLKASLAYIAAYAVNVRDASISKILPAEVRQNSVQ